MNTINRDKIELIKQYNLPEWFFEVREIQDEIDDEREAKDKGVRYRG